MLTLRNTVALALASTLVTVQIAALPYPQEVHQQRAVDVTAFTPWEQHPSRPAKAQSIEAQPAATQSAGAQPAESQSAINSLGTTQSPDPKKTSQINDDSKKQGPDRKRANNPEGFVPYMHVPSNDDTTGMKRAVVPAALVHANRDSKTPAAPPHVKRDDYQTVVDENRDEKPVNVVPIVGRSTEKRGLDTDFSIKSPSAEVRRDIDPLATIEENRNEKAVNVVPIVGRAAEKRSLDTDFVVNMPSNEGKRDIDPLATVEENRNEKAVNVVPIVGRVAEERGLDSDFSVNSPSNEGKRDIDPLATIEANRNEKAVNVVPIVGRGLVPPENMSKPAKICDADFRTLSCDSEDQTQATNAPRAEPEKREAVPNPEPISDKLSCNGQRYLPSQQTCTADGLVSNTASPQTTAAGNDNPSSPALKRAAVTAQCGSGIGSISYDRSTSYCDPVTKQVSPIVPMTAQGVNAAQQNSASSPAAQLANLGAQGQRRAKRDSTSLYGPDGEFAERHL